MAETAENLGQGGGATALRAELRAEQKKLVLVREIGQALSSALDLDRLLSLIMEKITILMEADRSTLYLFSDDGRELWSKVLQGGEILEIRLKVGEGIAGWVAASGEIRFIAGSPMADTAVRCRPMRSSVSPRRL